jgi:hypothetical protein
MLNYSRDPVKWPSNQLGGFVLMSSFNIIIRSRSRAWMEYAGTNGQNSGDS